jgi:hypothetical protein
VYIYIDAGASLHPAKCQPANTFNMHSMEERGANPLIFKFENVITVVRSKSHADAFVHVVDRVTFNG